MCTLYNIEREDFNKFLSINITKHTRNQTETR